jgi:fatty-acyl-CoA synthase
MGVVLSERNISANIQSIAELTGMNPRDTLDLWIPLFHDMGLMGSLTTIICGANLRICSPSVFLADPLGWLLRFAACGGTLNPSPNFFFRMLIDDYDAERAKGLDLRRWRVAFNGAELVRAEDVERFQRVFGPHGFPPTTMFPVYGMAETSLALTFPAYGTPPRVIRGDEVFDETAPPHLRRRRYVSVGRAFPGHEITVRRLAGDEGVELPAQVGEIMGRGPSIMQGYAVASSAELVRPFVDGWLPTRDLGFLHDGELFILGRLDEVLVVRGANYFPEDIEALVEQSGALSGVQVIAKAGFRLEGSYREGAAGGPSDESVALAVEVKDAPDGLSERLRRLEGDLLRELGFPVRVLALGPRSIPRTTSGKLKRLALAAMVARGELADKVVATREGEAPRPKAPDQR